MYFSAYYFGQKYFGPGYWAARLSTGADCSGGPYVVTGYWITGYAECDLVELQNPVYGKPWNRTRGKRRDDANEWRAHQEAWDAIERARAADRRSNEPSGVAPRQQEVGSLPPSTTITVTAETLAAMASVETNERKRKSLLALLLILTEV